MQREIRFRCWQGGRFHYWGFIKSHYGDGYEFHSLADTNAEPLSMAEKMERSQQYTGLKDKNGVECYWDDWVTDGINPKFLVTPDYHLLARLSEIEFEIVGNKHEG